jgi:hypothetical protein
MPYGFSQLNKNLLFRLALCSFYEASQKQCTCTMAMVQKYQKRISGPILDRIDIHLEVPRVPMQKLASLDGGEASASIRRCVEVARTIQDARFAPIHKPNLMVNGDMGPADVQQFCQLDKEGLAMIRTAVESMGEPPTPLNPSPHHFLNRAGGCERHLVMVWTFMALALSRAAFRNSKADPTNSMAKNALSPITPMTPGGSIKVPRRFGIVSTITGTNI